MPEAAEVAVAAGQLGHVAVGRRLLALRTTHDRTVRATGAGALEAFVGREVVAVERHGKWIVVRVDGRPDGLGIHLRMSGQLLVQAPATPHPDRHVHGVLELGERTGAPVAPVGIPGPPGPLRSAPVEVWFRDPRTFGELRHLAGARPPGAPDLFDPTVDGAVLHDLARRRRVGVKAVLLDQARTIAGVGSYLADEALHVAGIAPVQPADRLAVSAWRRILAAARDLAVRSAAVGGVTLADEGWVDLWGRPGRFAEQLAVHARPSCVTCGTRTRTAVVGGRSARWCPRCQDARRRR